MSRRESASVAGSAGRSLEAALLSHSLQPAPSSLTTSLADAAGVVVDGPENTIGSATRQKASGRSAIVQSLVVGGVTFSNHRVLVVDDEQLRFTLPDGSTIEIAGIMGWNVLKHIALQVDLNTSRARIGGPSSTGPNPDPTLLWFLSPLVRVSSPDGTPMTFLIETGAAASVLRPSAVVKLGKQSVRTESRDIEGAGGWKTARADVIEAVRLT